MTNDQKSFSLKKILHNFKKLRRIDYVLLCLLTVIIVLISLLFVLNSLKKNGNQSSSPLIRQTTHGPVEGVELTTSLGQKYYAFRGIPFAEPPITGIDPYTGEYVDRRFMPPEPLKRKWNETLKVHDFRELCQPSAILPETYQKFNFSEDCLFVNIFVPAGGAEKKTVLVYIHGAGLDGGVTTDMRMAPDFLLSQDNIVVHVEYRVTIFGFVNLAFGEFTGNMGLKDQQLCLKWIYDNIEYFSGKKDEIMIFGQSLGATFVHAHILNEKSRKYFTRAYLSSGSASGWKVANYNHTEKLQTCLEVNATSNELIDLMKTANLTTLAKCSNLTWIVYYETPNATDAFITKTPDEIYNSDNPPVMDTMFSITSQEALQMHPHMLEYKELLLENWNKSRLVLPFTGFYATTYPKEFEQAMDLLKEAYVTNTTILDEIVRQNIAYLSDVIVREDVLKSVVNQVNANNKNADKRQRKNTFLFRFSGHTDLNVLETKHNKTYTGAAHSDDLCYMFYCHFLNKFKPGVYENHLESKDNVYDMIMRRVKMVTNFARYGDPSIEGDNPFRSSKSSDEIYCQESSNEEKTYTTENIKEQLRYDAWRKVENIYKNLNKTT